LNVQILELEVAYFGEVEGKNWDFEHLYLPCQTFCSGLSKNCFFAH